MLYDAQKLWTHALSQIELLVSKPNFKTWFKDTYINKIDDGTVYLAVPSAFVRDWLLKKFHGTILKLLREQDTAIRAVEYAIVRDDTRRRHLAEIERRKENTPPQASSLPLEEVYINRDDNLNPRYTFESFVVGGFNELAHAAAQAIISRPGKVYNPFFIYGQTGHGKTHLIQAIGNHIKATSGGTKKVFYVTSEKFTQELVNAIQNNKVNQFKDKYRLYDVLIIDDIQFLSGKDKTQEELFHIFNNLYEDGKQIVFSSDKHPNMIPNLEDRLRSRFGAGMIVDVPTPDHESRIAILRTKVGMQNIPLSDECIDMVAREVASNIRELEGILNTIACQTELKGRELSITEIKQILRHTSKPKKNVAVKDVIKLIADFYNIEEEIIYDKTRRKEVVRPRQIIMYILREDFGISFPTIGDKLGGRDHTTVMHSCEKIREELKSNSILAQELLQIRSLM